ncbi:hypothetical protein C5Z26_00520 [Lactobacillus sp. CBA3606]|uniref:hypothetical protein n=1 Tax=Lactobacillus sp. CBA3606 TaxID=2099789 RepID=UPI000CFDD3CD|nr:hypothetical protein [Lactobacillus sp. CBA3606]AVK62713.1 hypothetical protein C5Z26_00520 [Lactobacillus sp. CBA3606]
MGNDNNKFKNEITSISEKIDLKLAKKNNNKLLVCSPEAEETRAVVTANLVLYWINKQEKVLLVETGESEKYANAFGFEKNENEALYRSKINQLFMMRLNSINPEKKLRNIFDNSMNFDKIIVDISSDLDEQNFSLLVANVKNVLLVTKENGDKHRMRKQLRMIDDFSKIIGYVAIK